MLQVHGAIIWLISKDLTFADLLGIEGEFLLMYTYLKLAEPLSPSKHGQICVAAPWHLRGGNFFQPKTPQIGDSSDFAAHEQHIRQPRGTSAGCLEFNCM